VWTRFVLVVSVLAGSVSAAGAIEPGAPITVAPGEGPPFTVVTVSGADCTDGPSPSVAGMVRGGPEVGAIAFFVATPDDTGAWTGSFTVPPNQPAGPYEVAVECKTDPGALEGVAYGSETFTIVEGPEATMTVSPRTGRAGTDVTVTASGTLCLGPDATVDLRAFVQGTEEADEFVARATATPATDGTWTGRLTIPDAQPVTYGVSGLCSIDGQPFVLYDVADVVVSPAEAPPARPLPARPTFTG
jgi:hypothetical protein